MSSNTHYFIVIIVNYIKLISISQRGSITMVWNSEITTVGYIVAISGAIIIVQSSNDAI